MSDSFLGRGWHFPPTFTPGGAEVATIAGEADVHESLHILLSTRMGERIMQEDYGCDLSRLAFEEIDQDMVNVLTGIITDAILFHEPRAILHNLEIDTDDMTAGRLMIRLDYTIAATNSRFNMVYPFYIDETARDA